MLPFSSIFDILMSGIYTGKLCTFALSGFLRAQPSNSSSAGLRKINKDKFHALLEDEALVQAETVNWPFLKCAVYKTSGRCRWKLKYLNAYLG
ncbi:hypothetical protein C5167_031012 [Papaver somniferum]|nr:hypothetical protein C5167_031012 [Papaver somniferum]